MISKKHNKLLVICLFIILGGAIFLFEFFIGKHFILAENTVQNNFGGWSWNSSFGWNSENCNNRYFGNYQDYCGISNENLILDIGFDGGDINTETLKIKDNSPWNNTIYPIPVDSLKYSVKNRKIGINYSNFNNYLDFSNGTILNISPTLSIPNEVTFSFWLKSTIKTQPEGLFKIGTEGMTIYPAGGKLATLLWYINPSDKVTIDNFFMEDGNWYYYTIVRSGKTVWAYRNGQAVGGKYNFSSVGGVKQLSGIGAALCSNCGTIQNFSGQMDEIRIYKSVLSYDEFSHNMTHNSNYWLDIDDSTSSLGKIMGWIWSNGIGWICFGETCNDYGNPPSGSLSDTKLNWSGDQGNYIYPHMVTGWAKAISFDESGQEKYKNTGWISLQGQEIFSAIKNYKNCVSCSVRDEDNGLVGYWKFNEDAGDIASDSSGNSYNGTLDGFGGNTWIMDTECKINNCLRFNSNQNQIKISPTIPLSNIVTISWWSKQDTPKESGIFSLSSYDSQGGIYGMDDGSFIWRIDDRNEVKITEKYFLFDSNWHYYVATKNDKTVEIYRDGESLFKSEFRDENITQNLDAVGSAHSDTRDLYFEGYMDHVKVYNNRLLTEDEIIYSYKYLENRFCSGCFNELNANQNNICYQCSSCNISDDGINTCADCTSCRKYGLVFDSNTANIKGYAWGGFDVNSGSGLGRPELGGVGWTKFSPNFAAGLYRSYVSTKYGNIYSESNIGSDYTIIPPIGYFNSSYMIQANGHIINWVSQEIAATSSDNVLFYDYNIDKPWMNYYDNPNGFVSPVYEYPKLANDYGNILGSLDYEGLKSGIYGEVVNHMPNESMSDPNVCLDGKVYYINPASGRYELGIKGGSGSMSYLFKNNCEENGSGIIIVDGDLTIKGNVNYSSGNVETNYKQLASVAWIIKGDLYIDGGVSNLAGTFIVLGKDEVSECGSNLASPTQKCGIIYTGDSSSQLVISGQILAKNFQFQRTFRNSSREPSELIIYDGRNIINPPPGLGDVVKSLPRWDQISPD